MVMVEINQNTHKDDDKGEMIREKYNVDANLIYREIF